MNYQLKDGARLHGNPQAIGQRLEQLRQKHGELTADQVLTDARNPKSPLHDDFEWDDTAAAEQYRLAQARYILRSIVVVYDEAPEVPTRAFILVDSGSGEAYQSTCVALSDADMRLQVLEKAKKEMAAFRRRYSELRELAEVFSAIDAALAAWRGGSDGRTEEG